MNNFDSAPTSRHVSTLGTAWEAVRLCSASLDIPPVPMARLDLFRQYETKFYWHDPEAGHEFLGLGAAAVLTGVSEDRFEAIVRQAQTLFGDALIWGEEGGPCLFGGFAFTSDYLSDLAWQSFDPACFVLPHYQIRRRGDQFQATINILVDRNLAVEELRPVCLEALNRFVAETLAPLRAEHPQAPEGEAGGTEVRISDLVGERDWTQAVNQVLSKIDRGDVGKVVLANIRELRSRNGYDLARAIRILNARYANCRVYLFQREANSAFLGASPELLCSLSGHELRTMALAGTTPRHRSEDADRRSWQELWHSRKCRLEHRIVVDAIVDTLRKHELTVEFSQSPGIMSLHNVHHLHTPIKARGSTRNAIEWASILHPTPALGGDPRAAAMRMISDLELQPRGWYGAPVGLVDHKLQGTFAVAIRSGVVHGDRAWLFAGVGLVEESDPSLEWQEMDWKFQSLQSALT